MIESAMAEGIEEQVEVEEVEGAEPSEGAEGAEGTEVEGAEPAAGVGAWPVQNGNALSAEARKTLEQIKATDPALARHLKSALFQADAYRKEFPNGLTEYRELKGALEQMGGMEAVQQSRQEIEGWLALDEKFTRGDPAFLSTITETPEGKASFLQLAPDAVDLFSRMNPEGYSSYMANTFLNHMYQQGMTLDFQRLGDFVKENPSAQELWNKLAGYFNGLSEMSKKAMKPERQAAQPKGDADSLAARERELVSREYSETRGSLKAQIFEPELTRILNGRKVNDKQRAAIVEVFGSRLRGSLNGLTGHKEKVDRYVAAQDKAGFEKYFRATYATEIPKALRAAVDVILPASRPAQGAKPVVPGAKPAAPVAASAGYIRVSKMPSMDELKPGSNSPDMFREGRAILKDGRKVQWK